MLKKENILIAATERHKKRFVDLKVDRRPPF